MSEFEQAMIEELRAIRALLERQVAPVVQEEVRQLLTASDDARKAHNRDVLARARQRLKAAA
ncbi:hypothetical protein F6V25_07870 [Oryzomonas japonica]|uniref:Uncharacterized protein n=1 Tax=Oryzomonas japonica TaxID=2603858 RepID=A0A7J4ZR36_9BACT|nr:hypothetical protein [Oryzomonas japonica]KAB0665630.1 hypothetical protein F6V25_07870 [Oryzomonas japonica]